MRTRIALIFPLLCAPLAFWACGDDAGNDSNGSESAGCTVSENKDGSYTVSCADGTEAVLHDGEDGNDGTDGKDGSSCTVAVSKDSSTYILICDGKVVGEISDGSDGKDGKDGLDGNDGADGNDGKNGKDGADGTSCTVADTTDASTGRTGYNLVCDGERKGIVWNGVDGKDAEVPLQSSSSSEHDPEIVEIRNKSISGESQFVAGSTVKLYELDGETCAQTGKSFAGKIINDNGELKISSVTLASQYALLEVSGYYRSVVNGETSSGIITLNALVDLSNREKVNVNMLTHLEYERALYLVGTGMKVSAAKNQAETEILGAFGIEGNFANSEDLNIFGESEESAVLLAISVLMQGGRGAEKLTEFLSKIAIDIEKDGEWNDETVKTQIADWSAENDWRQFSGLESIRYEIEGWNLGVVPNFEKYVRSYLYMNYGLGACDENSQGVVKAVTNEKVTIVSKYYCATTGWIALMGVWRWNVPKEVRLNPEIDYGEMADPRDGQVYKTVKIGDQVWMAENLNYSDSTKTPSLKGGSWCYDNRAENCDVTGRLYTWAAAIDSVALANDADNPQTCGYGKTCTLPTVVQGVCPDGWHLPTNAEWNTLFTAVGGSSTAVKILKSGSGWYGNDNGTDAYGFSALPAGYRNYNGNFYGAGNYADFWSATQDENYSHYAYYMYLDYSNGAGLNSYGKRDGYSVRCLQN